MEQNKDYEKGLQRMVVWYNAVERRMLESRIVV